MTALTKRRNGSIGDRPDLAHGDRVVVEQPGIRPWEGEVLSVKPGAEAWMVDVRNDEHLVERARASRQEGAMTRGRISFDTVERRIDALDVRLDRIRIVVSTLQKWEHVANGNRRRQSLPTIGEARDKYAHGTEARYVLGRCRCFECRVAHSRMRAEQVADESRRLISIRDVRKHLAFLQRHGIGPKTVSAVSGVSYSVLQRMLGYPSGRKPIERTRRATAERILAVGLSAAGGNQKVPGGPTWELIDCLLAAGWPRYRVSLGLGHTAKNGMPALQLHREYVYGSTARKVERLHREAWRLDARVREVCRHESPRLRMENGDHAHDYGKTVREIERAAQRRNEESRRLLRVEEGVA